MFMNIHEPYMQVAFQFEVDEGCLSDDSHKLTSHIYSIVGGKKVQPFTVTYSVLGLNGKCPKNLKSLGKLNDDWY